MVSKKSGNKQSSKKTMGEKASQKGTLAAIAPLTLTVAPGNLLMSPTIAPTQFSGNVHYQGVAAFLVGNGGQSLLVMYRPQGNYSPADIGAAASYMSHIVGKGEGSPAIVLGYTGVLFGANCILVISAS